MQKEKESARAFQNRVMYKFAGGLKEVGYCMNQSKKAVVLNTDVSWSTGHPQVFLCDLWLL